MQVKDKVFVVTGGGNGIAREVVFQLLAKGARVAAVDVSEKGLTETAMLAHAGDRLSTHVVDITNRAAVEALPAAVLAQHGQIDGVTHIAGIIHRFAPLTDLSIEEIEKVVRVNYWGTVYVSKTFLPYLLERPQASLVNFSSMGALVPVPGQGAYGSSKAAVKLFTETLFAELRGTNVAVTVVFPGGVATNITGNSGVAAPAGSENVDTSKVTMTMPHEAARLTVEAIENGTPRLRIGKDAIALDRLSRFNPVKAIGIIADKMKSLLGDGVTSQPQHAAAAPADTEAAA